MLDLHSGEEGYLVVLAKVTLTAYGMGLGYTEPDARIAADLVLSPSTIVPKYTDDFILEYKEALRTVIHG